MPDGGCASGRLRSRNPQHKRRLELLPCRPHHIRPRVHRHRGGARDQTCAVISPNAIPVDVVASWSWGLSDVIALFGAAGTILVAGFALVQTQRLARGERDERARRTRAEFATVARSWLVGPVSGMLRDWHTGVVADGTRAMVAAGAATGADALSTWLSSTVKHADVAAASENLDNEARATIAFAERMRRETPDILRDLDAWVRDGTTPPGARIYEPAYIEKLNRSGEPVI